MKHKGIRNNFGYLFIYNFLMLKAVCFIFYEFTIIISNFQLYFLIFLIFLIDVAKLSPWANRDSSKTVKRKNRSFIKIEWKT
jgi:hypothetical protein